MTTSPPPTYAEAVSEDHRPNHTPTWEPTNGGRMCILCGHIDRATPMHPPIYIGPVDWLMSYLAGEQIPVDAIATDTSPFCVVLIHPAQVNWLGHYANLWPR